MSAADVNNSQQYSWKYASASFVITKDELDNPEEFQRQLIQMKREELYWSLRRFKELMENLYEQT